MSDLFNSNPFASSARQFAQSALKANSLAFEGFENIVKLQLQTVESSFKSSVAFLTEAADVADLESAKTIWPKGASLVKDSSEQLYATSQQVFGQALKTSEAIGQLYRDQFQAANDSLVKVANKAKKAAAI